MLLASVRNEMFENVYQACVQPSTDYCITLWGYARASLTSKVLFFFQNRAARILVIGIIYTRTVSFVKQIGWMNVMERRDYFMGMLVHSICQRAKLSRDLLYLVSDMHSVPTRSNINGDFMCPTLT